MARARRAGCLSDEDRELLSSVFARLDRSPPVVAVTRSRRGQDCEFIDKSIFWQSRGLCEGWWGAVDRIALSDAGCGAAVASMIGMAIGDAVGHPLEFTDVDQGLPDGPNGYLDPARPQLHPNLAEERVSYSNPFNRFELDAGQWTDDTSMALCLADTLLANRGYHGGDARMRWHMWWSHGYNNAFLHDTERPNRCSVGLGGNVAKSLAQLNAFAAQESGDDPDLVPPIYDSKTNDSGNGTIMRLAPVPIAYHHSPRDAMDVAAMQSRATHPGGEAAACCCFMAFFIVQAITLHRQGSAAVQDARVFIDTVVEQFVGLGEADLQAFWRMEGCSRQHSMDRLVALLRCEPPSPKEMNWNWKLDELAIAEAIALRIEENHYNGHPVIPTYFGAYCMDGLAMAMWSLWHSADFSSCIQRAINLLGDADTVGAIAGQMAGALYGWPGLKASPWSMCCIRDLSQTDPYCEVGLRGALLYFHGPRSLLQLRQADGHSMVRMFEVPQPGSNIVGEVPSGSVAECVGEEGDFYCVVWQGTRGWVGLKNCHRHPARGTGVLFEASARH